MSPQLFLSFSFRDLATLKVFGVFVYMLGWDDGMKGVGRLAWGRGGCGLYVCCAPDGDLLKVLWVWEVEGRAGEVGASCRDEVRGGELSPTDCFPSVAIPFFEFMALLIWHS